MTAFPAYATDEVVETVARARAALEAGFEEWTHSHEVYPTTFILAALRAAGLLIIDTATHVAVPIGAPSAGGNFGRCRKALIAAGLASPRTCQTCGKSKVCPYRVTEENKG